MNGVLAVMPEIHAVLHTELTRAPASIEKSIDGKRDSRLHLRHEI
jgi:hypothetical protein